MQSKQLPKCPVNKKNCKYNKNGNCTMRDPKKNCDELAEPYTGEIVVVTNK